MTPSRILAVALVALVASTVACSSSASSSSDPPAEPATPNVRLQGVYQSETPEGAIAVIDFLDDTHYRAWRTGGGPCAALKTGDAVPDSCAETGRYVLANGVLSLTDDQTGNTDAFQFQATSFVDGSSTVTPQDQLVGGGQQLAQQGQVTASGMQLTNKEGILQRLVKPSTLCHAACWGVAALGPAAVSLVCTGATVITIGGAAIPCSVAIPASAVAAGAGASICADAICPP